MHGQTVGESFIRDTGAPQGDCLSAIEFTYYLHDLSMNIPTQITITPIRKKNHLEINHTMNTVTQK